MADFFTWVGRAAHGGHAVRTLSREGDAATVTRRRTDVPQWYQGAGMNGSDLEKNRDLSPILSVAETKHLDLRSQQLRVLMKSLFSLAHPSPLDPQSPIMSLFRPGFASRHFRVTFAGGE